MRVVLDACVLFPDLVRELLLSAASAGAFEPLWSERILQEWAHAAVKKGGVEPAAMQGELALLGVNWPCASTSYPVELEEKLDLPDLDDRHVLAAAIAGEAGEIVTFNLADFPARALARHGVIPRDPDRFLLEIFQHNQVFRERMEALRMELERHRGEGIRRLLKRARLPKLGKAFENAQEFGKAGGG